MGRERDADEDGGGRRRRRREGEARGQVEGVAQEATKLDLWVIAKSREPSYFAAHEAGTTSLRATFRDPNVRIGLLHQYSVSIFGIDISIEKKQCAGALDIGKVSIDNRYIPWRRGAGSNKFGG